jgi:hypothetical protein
LHAQHPGYIYNIAKSKKEKEEAKQNKKKEEKLTEN